MSTYLIMHDLLSDSHLQQIALQQNVLEVNHICTASATYFHMIVISYCELVLDVLLATTYRHKHVCLTVQNNSKCLFTFICQQLLKPILSCL